ncbi:MAG TPA: shikimate kinase, partial [Myxococcaceae bacterium]|nr:shikimate kinase [Myxococcaceae bacterium]
LPMARLRVAVRADLGSIFLVGPMAAGKTSVGLALSRRIGRPFVDLDGRIESQAGASIAQIFARSGEQGFREQEKNALAEVAAEPSAVVALGGGAVQSEAAWRLVRRSGVVLSLHAEPEELLRRIRASERPIQERPLLAEGDPLEALKNLARSRERFYARADLHLSTEGLDAEAAAAAAVGLLRSLEGPLPPRRRAEGEGIAAPEGEA